MRNLIGRFLGASTLAFLVAGISSSAFAQDASWRVSKSSGDVWVATSGAHTVSLTQDAVLKPGDRINTGRNGRVLLVRGQETILVAPNSAIGIPTEKKDGMATTITQQAGSILLNVEKQNVQHFSVETPYLAAVVKGTEFRVTVNAAGSRVDVLGGSVEVADFKTGQYAMVQPGQAAQVSLRGAGGLSLQGPGTLSPIQKGAPRESSVKRIPVPRGGLSAPQYTAPTERRAAAPGHSVGERKQVAAKPAIRIAMPLGEVKMDFKKVTKGLARGTDVAAVDSKAGKGSVWSSGDLKPGNGASKESGRGNNGSASASVVSGTGASSASASASASGSAVGDNSGPGNGNGNAYGLTKDKTNKGKGKNKG
jgi:hypothetical protein